jgi:pimeloyl-ACP methyl ester carboxylesterase
MYPRWAGIERVIQQSEAKMSTGNYATVNGHPIYYEQSGVGRPVVLLHGGLHTIHLSFEKQIAPFAEHYHVIAIEQVGHGHSADIEGPFSYAHMAEDTAALLRAWPHQKCYPSVKRFPQ